MKKKKKKKTIPRNWSHFPAMKLMNIFNAALRTKENKEKAFLACWMILYRHTVYTLHHTTPSLYKSTLSYFPLYHSLLCLCKANIELSNPHWKTPFKPVADKLFLAGHFQWQGFPPVCLWSLSGSTYLPSVLRATLYLDSPPTETLHMVCWNSSSVFSNCSLNLS